MNVYTKMKKNIGGIRMGLTSLLRYGVGEPEKYERKRPYYLMKKDGVYRHTSTGAMLIKDRYIDYKGKSVPGLVEGSEGVEYMLPKIDFKYWLMILDFYKAVYEQDKTEAAVHIYYTEEGSDLEIPLELEDYKVGLIRDGNWLVYCPQQRNSGTLTSFGSDELYKWLRENTISVVETHSHHTMSTFWSGTDTANQQDTQYYAVYGHINTEDDFLLKYVVNGEAVEVCVTDVFEYPMVVTSKKLEGIKGYEDILPEQLDEEEEKQPYKGVFKRKDEFPEEWLTSCHTVSGGGYGKENDKGSRGTGYQDEWTEEALNGVTSHEYKMGPY